MDPALHELIRAGRSEDEVAVLLRLDRNVVPHGVRIVARFGSIATARVIRGTIPQVHESLGVHSVKAPRLYVPDWLAAAVETEVGEIRPSDQRRPEGLPQTGRSVVVALIDWGLDFAHPDFRNDDGSSRVLALWDQRSRTDGRSNNHYGYGWIHDQPAINSALASSDPYLRLAYHPADAGSGPTHGTHTAGIAAGNGRSGGPAGIAPEADIIFVHLATATGERGDNLGDSAALFEAIDFVAKAAGQRPWVLNTSLGRHAGPHDDSPLLVQGIDAALAAAPGRACIQSTGNYYNRPIHTQGVLRPGEVRDIRFQTAEEDGFTHEIDIWYAGSDRIVVEVIAPESQSAGRASTAEQADLIVRGERVGRLYNRFRDPNNFDNEATVFLNSTAPRGSWILRLHGTYVEDGRYHCWVERDPACSTCQPSFDLREVEPLSTTGTICNGRLSIAVGAYDAHSTERPLAPFSSAGPTRDGRTKPDLIAPGVDVLSARSASRQSFPGEPGIVRMSGTSMAAPYVTGTVALVFQAAGQLLPVGQMRNLLLATAEPLTSGDSQFRWGSGYADMAAAVAAALDVNSGSAGRSRKHFIPTRRPRDAAESRPREVLSLPTDKESEAVGPPKALRVPITQERSTAMGSSTLIRDEQTKTETACSCRKAKGESGAVTLQQVLEAPGVFARHWEQNQTIKGFEITARPGQPLTSHPQPGDILIHVIEGGGGHAAVVSAPGLWRQDELVGFHVSPEGEPGEGYVQVSGEAFLQGAAEGRAHRVTDSAGRLLDDLLLIRLATPTSPTPPVVVQQTASIPQQQPAVAPLIFPPSATADPPQFDLPEPAPIQDDQAQEDEVSCDHIDASKLSWPGASTQQFDLMRRVYLRQVTASCQLRHFIGDVPDSDLAEIEDGKRARTAAAANCRTLLATAREAIRLDPAAVNVRSIGVVSGYRSASQQLSGWNRTFPRYYSETKTDRAAADDGEFGDAAAALLTRYISHRLAAPGFSLHNDGRAIDFSTVQGGKSIGADTSERNRKNWRASWFFEWLMGNANGYGFFQNIAIDEPWHWEFRAASAPTQAAESWSANLNFVPSPDTSELAGEAWPAAPGELTIARGRQELRNTPLLSAHRGTQPDLILRWNDMADPRRVDVVVHLHGYSSDRKSMKLLNKEAYSGLDFSNPTDLGDARPGRNAATLGILPRGSYAGDQQGVRNPESYSFPALTASGGVSSLIAYSLNQFRSAVGLSTSVSQGRLIVTAHSGGGEALMPIVAEVQPDEVHVFDALYWDASRLITWVKAQIAAEIASWIPGKTFTDGGLCILYRRGGTESQSVRVHRSIQKAIAAAPADAQAVLRVSYRVLRTAVAHPEIPRQFGWLLLAGIAQPLAETYAPSEVESVPIEAVPDEQSSSGPGESYIDSAFNGTNGAEAFFFLADNFVTYSWTNDKVVDGVHPISEWLLPPAIATPGASGGIDAALSGKRSYAGKVYFFKGSSYARVNTSPRALETTVPGSLADSWSFPPDFASGINAAFNGRFSREGKAYFFKQDRYLRYSWGDATGRGEGVDMHYPKPIINMLRMPPNFSAGVEAAVDGDGAFTQYGYLFKKDRYIRFNWNPAGGEPFVDGPALLVQDKWEGLVELLLAGKAKSQGLEWLRQARQMLNEYAGFLGRNALYPYKATMDTALSAHFHITIPPSSSPGVISTVQQIGAVYDSIEAKLRDSSTIFLYKSKAQAGSEGMAGNPAYGVFNGSVSFTPDFVSQGPLGRAAMVLHETVHVLDNQSGLPTTHISEWYVTDAEADRLGLNKALTSPNQSAFATRYNLMSTADSLHNPSSYAAFAQHVFYGSDTRYGAGRPNQ